MQMESLGVHKSRICSVVHSSLFRCPLCAVRWAKSLGYTGEQDDMVTALLELSASSEGSHSHDCHEGWLCCGGKGTLGAQDMNLLPRLGVREGLLKEVKFESKPE